MGLLQITAILAGMFALLNWLILPWLDRLFTKPMPGRPILLIMTVLLGRVLRGVCLIGALAFGAIILALAGVWLAGHSLTIGQLEPIYHTLATLRQRLETLDTGWAVLTIGVLSVGLWLSVRQDAYKQLRAARDGAVVKAVADIEAETQAGTTIAPTPEMASVSARLDQLGVELGHAFAAREPDKADSLPDPETEPALAGMIKQFQLLREELQVMDVVRRLDIGGQLADVSKPPVKSEGRFGRFLASAGLVKGMGSVSRALTTASLVLLAPTLLTITGGALAEAIEQTHIAIHDLIIAESEAQAEREWRTGMPPPPQPRKLTQDDQALIHQLSLHYQHYARAHVAREYHVSPDSTAVRRRVLDDFAAAESERFEVTGGPGDQPGNAKAGPEPFGAEAKRAQAILEEHGRNSSELDWSAFKVKATAFVKSFGEPLSSGDLGQRLFTEILVTAQVPPRFSNRLDGLG